jgi:hypothetical protein
MPAQIEDGFFVKHTADLTSTIAYLVLVTRFLQGMFAGVTLVADGRDAAALAAASAGPTRVLRTYPDFAVAAVKTKVRGAGRRAAAGVGFINVIIFLLKHIFN